MRDIARYIISILIAGVCAVAVNSQSTQANYMLSPETNEIIPPSPSSAQQIRYQSPQPSLATGAVNLSIPLYTLDVEGLSIPFTMSYQTSGIKPADDPLPFGYGWSLQPALKIVRTIRGRADEDYEYRGDRPGDFQLNPSDAFAAMCRVSPGGLSAENTQNRYDAEKDIFTISLPSGVYTRIIVKDPADSSRLLFVGGGDDNEIIITGTLNLSEITVTDAHGIIYRFGDVKEIAYIPPGPDAPAITSWELSDITLPSGRKISFIWTVFDHNKIPFVGGDIGRDSYNPINAYQFHQDWLTLYPQSGFTNDGYYRHRAHLSNVYFPDGSITLDYDQQKLSSFTVCNGLGTEIRKAVFTYGTSDVDSKFLATVDLSGEGQYVFTYNPRRFDDSSERMKQDWWGYYNGRGGYPYQITSLTPALKLKFYNNDFMPGSYEAIGYSDRNPDAEAMQAGILTKITYPTGGSSEFTYEPHRFTPQKVNSHDNISPETDPELGWGGGLRVKTITTRTGSDDPLPQIKTYLYGPAVVTAVPSAATFVSIAHGIGLFNDRTLNPILYHFRNVSVAAQSDYMNNHIGEDAIWYDKVVERNDEGMTEYHFTRTIPTDAVTREWGFVAPSVMRNIFSKGARLTAKHVFKKTGSSDSIKVYSEEYTYAPVLQKKYVQNNTVVGSHISRYLLQTAVNTIESPDFTNGEFLSYVAYVPNEFNPQQSLPHSIKIKIEDITPDWLSGGYSPYRVEPYTIELRSDRLASKTVTRHLDNGDFVTTEKYEYIDGTSIIKSVSTTTSNDPRTDRIDIEYPTKGGGTVQSAMVADNMVGVPVKTTRRFGSATTVVTRDMASYGNRVYRPKRVLQSFGGQAWVAGWYDYDNFGNLREYRGEDSVPTTYLWGYSGLHPVYGISGAAYSQIKGLGLPGTAYNGSADAVDATSRLDQWLATRLQWSPLVGVTSQRAPDGLTSTYTYDSAGRLIQTAISGHGNVAAYSYHINDGGLNYTETKAYTSSSASSVREIINYDGLGRPTTSLTAAADALSLTSNYYATLTQYDAMDRPFREWATVKVDNPHPTETQISSAASDVYGDAYSYHTTFYEPSPLAVTTGSRKAGKEWNTADRRIAVRHLVNKASGDYACPKYIDYSDAEIKQNGFYPAGSLTIEEITDEEGHVTMTFTDSQGLTLMTREGTPSSAAQPKWLDTRYVYNDYGQLLYVIQPKLTQSTIKRSDLFRYLYDWHGNCFSKTYPAGEPTLYRYDNRNRLYAEQDGNMRSRGEWLLHFYDSFGREVLTFVSAVTDQNVASMALAAIVAVPPTSSSVINNSTGGYTLTGAPADLTVSELVEARYYDSYDFASRLTYGWKAYTVPSGFATPAASVRGLPTGSLSGKRLTVTHYDALNQPVRVASGEYSAVPELVSHTRYDYEGKVLEERTVTAGSLTAPDQKIERSYYKSGHLKSIAVSQASQSANVSYNYGGNGRISSSKFDKRLSRSDSYNANGWLTSSRTAYIGPLGPELELNPIGPINPVSTLGVIGPVDPIDPIDPINPIGPIEIETLIFEESLHYAAVPSGCTARYDGKIAGRVRGDNLTAYVYDTHGRLISATPKAYNGQSASAVPDLVTQYSYDANANITSLLRRGIVDIVGGTKVYGVHTDMRMSYSGNRLTSMTVSRDGADYEGRTGVSAIGSVSGFTYDRNGNLTADPSRGITRIDYNRLNLPVSVTFSDGHRQTVTYDGLGNKLRTDYYQLPATMVAGSAAAYDDSDYQLTSSRVYLGPHVFSDGKLEYSAFPGGYFDPKWRSARFYVTDWQGNNAAVVSSVGNIIQQTDYYPYGEPTVEPAGQRYLFGGKEREHAAGRNSYDFGARSLTPYGNWAVVDPLAEKFYQFSLYSYCGGDPVNRVDKDGEFWDTVWDIGNILYDVGSAIKAHIDGDHDRAKEHWNDALWDTGAAVIPFVPAGASKAAKVVKRSEKAADATKGLKNAERIQEGKDFEKRALQEAKDRGENVQGQVTLVPQNGKGNVKGNRTRTDQLIKDKDNTYIIGETKLTNRTSPTKGQRAANNHVGSDGGYFEVRTDVPEFGIKRGDKIFVKEYKFIYKETK